MRADQTFPGTTHQQNRRAAEAGAAALGQAARRIAQLSGGTRRRRTRDVVGLLLAHGARAWRLAQPEAIVTLRVTAPNGTMAVKLSIG